MWQTLKNGIRNVCAVMLTAVFLAGILLQNACVLRRLRGERNFYVYSASSQAKMQTALQPLDVFFKTGESVWLDEPIDAYALMQYFNAEVVYIERVGDTVSYYGFSPDLPRGIVLQGKAVNLHIAVSPRGCAVGTPIIFGGY